MHDIDRMTFEADYGEYEFDEFGYESEDEMEFQSEMYVESPFSEAEEMELAAELLNVSSEQELDQFLGKLIKRAGRAVGKFVKSPMGNALGGIIKGVAKNALPSLGGALGNLVLPGFGGMIGGKLGSAAGSMLGMELEGLSHEDQEFEVARQLVRLGGAATTNAAQSPQSASPQQTAQAAVATAAQQYAPGLLSSNSVGNRCRCGRKKSGRWVRQGNSIILYGV